MKCEIIIDSECEEKVVIYARENSKIVEEIAQIARYSSEHINGYDGKEIVRINPEDIHCISILDNKIFALLQNDKLLLKERLYVLIDRLPSNFIKINQSCIANIHKIERFDASLSGTLKVRFKNGHIEYVSRRQLKFVKERMGI